MENEYIRIQKEFFERIKQLLPPHVSLVHEVSAILNQSCDSAYRRIRGDHFLSLEEMLKLSTHFSISLDSICSTNDNLVTFINHSIDPLKYRLKDWIDTILHDMTITKEAPEKTVIYSAKDPPIYHYFDIPEIFAFRAFLWEKTVYQFPEYADRKFSFDYLDSDTLAKGRQISKLATKIPTIELWNEHTLLLPLKQIAYYWVAGLFESKDDVLNILDKVEQWFLHIRAQAQCGFKYLYDEQPEGIENSYILYETEVLHNDNLILAKIGDKTITYIAVNSLNLLKTTNPGYCENVYNFLQRIMLCSNLISHSGEKERNRFFNKHLYLLEEFRKRIG